MIWKGCVLLLSISGWHSSQGTEVDFAHEIVPILSENCGKCHSGSQREGGFSINDRESLLRGGESGTAITPGDETLGMFLERVASSDESMRMPPEGEALSAEEIELLRAWIRAEVPWESGFTFGENSYEPPLKPRMPKLPVAFPGRDHPIDRILDGQMVMEEVDFPAIVSDEIFLRRATLDLIGLLPTVQEREAFLQDRRKDKRERLVRELLNRDVDYAEHWLTFWNDLLRNDYTGTGFITGGRKQITEWLYRSLVDNKRYDQFARELIAPPTESSAGFADGIRWRGEVSAGQTVEIQFAQSVGQTFLGINLKCASCHDSFIDQWTLEDAYGLAAIYSEQSLELHRCDKPLGKMARPAWLFSELGQIDEEAPRKQRLEQLAALMTHRENGRFTRTIVNRLWHRLMGRGIVHPTDAMQTAPWNEDLLDYLAEDLVEHEYDLKHTLERIATSLAYQSVAESVEGSTDGKSYHYRGLRSKRMTAEQFMDSVWQITESGPRKTDANIIRGKRDPKAAADVAVAGQWIWNRANVADVPSNESLVFRKRWQLDEVPSGASATITCDNAYELYVNGAQVHSGNNWEAPDLVALPGLKIGENEILVIAKNGGSGPNPAGLFVEVRWYDSLGKLDHFGSDRSWQWTRNLPNKNGKFKTPPQDWQDASVIANPQVWNSRVEGELKTLISQGYAAQTMVRASLVKSDFLMRSLGRPNRDQIVSVRPMELTTLEAIDLSNGEILANMLQSGAAKLQVREWSSPVELVQWLYQFGLSREPTVAETDTITAAMGSELTASSIEDLLWTIVMLPEFQIVR